MTDVNPFSVLDKRLEAIERKLETLSGNNSIPEYLTITDACKFLNLTKSAIYRRTMLNEIPHMKSGSKLMFKKSDLVKFIEGSNQSKVKSNGITIEK